MGAAGAGAGNGRCAVESDGEVGNGRSLPLIQSAWHTKFRTCQDFDSNKEDMCYQ